MSHLDYYSYQATARGVTKVEDVARVAQMLGPTYELMTRNWLPADKNATLVDLACGHGSFLFWLKQKGYTNLIGVDSSREQTQFARSVGIRVETADAIQWIEQCGTGKFDVVFGIDFIEHIQKDDFMRLLKGASSGLRSRGSLILRYPNGDSPFVGRNLFNDITHVWTYTANCMRTLGEMHGFTEFAFVDEGPEAIQERRWIKYPIAKISSFLIRKLIQAATRERLETLHSNIWARLQK